MKSEAERSMPASMPVIRIDDASLVFSDADPGVAAGVKAWLGTLKYPHDQYGNFRGAGYRGSFRPDTVNRQLAQFLAGYLKNTHFVAVSGQQAASLGEQQERSRRQAVEDIIKARREAQSRPVTPPDTGTSTTENVPDLGGGSDGRSATGSNTGQPTSEPSNSPGGGSGSVVAQKQACFENQARITQAVERSNRDHNTKLDKLDTEVLIQLVKGGYLERVPEDPGQGLGTSGHYGLSDSGDGVTCSVHGAAPSARIQAAPADRNAQKQACFENQARIAQAVERSNRDHNTKLDKLDSEVLIQLVKGGYLERVPEDPGQGLGTSGHYGLTDSGNGVTCSVHGSAPTGPSSGAP